MRTTVARRWLVLLCVTAAGLVVADRVGWAADAGLDVWNLPELKRTQAAQEALDARYTDEYEAVSQRIMVKEERVADLVAGRATLAAVTDEFESLNRSDPAVMAILHHTYRSTDPREVNARSVLEFAESHTFASAAHKETALRPLYAEFAHLFPSAGALEPR